MSQLPEQGEYEIGGRKAMTARQTYRAGIYARLSRDDERQGESISIENQKLILTRFCESQGWQIMGCYVDDGWTGTNFDEVR